MNKPSAEHEASRGRGRTERPITQYEGTLAAPRAEPSTVQYAHDEAMEAVPGGRVRRIVFSGEHREQTGPVQERPEPEPTPEPREPMPERLEERPPYTPRHKASIEEIERDVDRITSRTRRPAPTPSTKRTWERKVYETEGGTVRRAGFEGSEGRREGLYVSQREGALERERRFSTTEIDRLVAGSRPSRSRSDVLEELSGSREAEGNEPEPAAETEELDRGAGGAAMDEDLSAPASRSAGKAYYDYKGEVYPIREVEGIGPKYATKLHQMGIATTSRLCYEDAAALAQQMGLAEKTVASWQAMSELMKVKGIGGQYAEALARAGISGIQELKERSANSIADQVQGFLDKQKRDIIGSPVTEKRVKNWQKAAKKMRRVRMAVPEE